MTRDGQPVPAGPSPTVSDHDKRDAKRFKVFALASVRVADLSSRAHVINISSSGAMLHAVDAPPIDAQLAVGIGGHETPATVTWLNDHRFGVRFEADLDPQVFEAVVGPKNP